MPDIEKELSAQDQVVDTLMRALARAKAGELDEVVVVAHQVVGDVWFSCSGNTSRVVRLGMMELAKSAVVLGWFSEDAEG